MCCMERSYINHKLIQATEAWTNRGTDTKKYSYIIKSVVGTLEVCMAIPVLGWMLVLFTGLPLFMMLFLHIVSLVVAFTTKTKLAGNIVGIFASLLSIFPVVG